MRFQTKIEFQCPFCGLHVSAGEDLDNNKPGVLHELPMCIEFAKDEPPDVYMRKAREAIARGMGIRGKIVN